MAANTSEHPSQETLRAYAQGRLPAAAAAQLDSHIETCAECGHVLGQVGSDTYSDLLRQSSTLFDGQKATSLPEVPAELHNHPRYEIGARLGGGGMGVVYRAIHRMMHRPVALKLIRPDLLSSPAAVERFRREVQAAARLTHPNIVTAYDAEEVAGMHFLVMEFVEGKTLEQYIGKRGPLSAAIACNLIRQAALGLDHAHSHGMVHRDIKPQNLIVTAKGKVKILDFGLAMWSEPRPSSLPQHAAETTTIGTLLYAAPEQLRSRVVDARADQFGLAATLYYLLTGRPPRSIGDDSRVLDAELLDFPDSVPDGIRSIVHKLLADSPVDRYPSAKAVADALAPWCRGQLQESHDPTDRRRILQSGIAGLIVVIGCLWGYALFRGRTPRPIVPVQPLSQDQQRNEGWHSLLVGFDPPRHKVMGYWRIVDRELRVGAVMGARIGIPFRNVPEYDFRFSFTRKTGIHSIGAVVVHGGHQVTFEVDAWEYHLAGLQDIAGQSMINNPTRRENYKLENGRRYSITIEVRKTGITCYLDGKLVTRHLSDGHDLSVNQKYWAMPDPTTLGLLAWDSETVFHCVEIRYLDQ